MIASPSILPFPVQIEREFIQGSAIAPEIFAETIGFIHDRGFWEPNHALGLDVKTQWQIHRPHSFGEIACFLNEDDSIWQAKPENPMVGKNDKPNKYQAPKGEGSRAFLPSLTQETREAIAHRFNCDIPHLVKAFGLGWSNTPKFQLFLPKVAKSLLACSVNAMWQSPFTG
jgi:hypothetical protein